jgi:hypothetical protein
MAYRVEQYDNGMCPAGFSVSQSECRAAAFGQVTLTFPNEEGYNGLQNGSWGHIPCACSLWKWTMGSWNHLVPHYNTNAEDCSGTSGSSWGSVCKDAIIASKVRVQLKGEE